jgi:hypothetical protein
MPFFQSFHVKMSSGQAGTTMQAIERVQSANINYSVPRADIGHLGRFKPLNQRPVVNYIPITYSVDVVKSSKEIETNFGLVNTTGVGIVIGKTNGSNLSDWGARNFEFYNAHTNSTSYMNKITLLSGCLNSYTVNATIGEPAKLSFGGESLEYKIESSNLAKEDTNYSASIVRTQDIFISGVEFSGVGLTGVNIQSFSLSLNFNRQAIGHFGEKFPDRPINGVAANLSINGYVEGFSNSSGVSGLDCGFPLTGSIYFTLVPSCSGASNATTYIVTNPYVDSLNLGASVGAFTSFDIGLSVPVSISPQETLEGSNLVII